MPRYFFDTPGTSSHPDTEGTVFAGLAEAREQAVIAAAEIIRLEGIAPWDSRPWEMRVTDETGGHVATLRFFAQTEDPDR